MIKEVHKSHAVLDLLLVATALWYVVSWLVTGRDPAGLAMMARALPYVVLYAGLRILFSVRGIRRYAELTALAGLCAWGAAEAACGLWQALGRGASHHAIFAMTGHFSNPGPFGGFIACVMAVAFAWVFPSLKPVSSSLRASTESPSGNGKGKIVPETGSKAVLGNKNDVFVPERFARGGSRGVSASLYYWIKRIAEGIGWGALAAGMLVLPASMSRTAWLGLAAAVLATLWHDEGVRGWLHRHRFVVPLGAVVAAALLAGAFLLKRESAVGRLHIWDIEARAVSARPLFGAGPGLGLGAYGDAQAAFFRDRIPDPSAADAGSFGQLPALLRTRVQAAGCPEFAFNEFLGIGMETGLPGLLLALSVVLLALLRLYRRRSPFAAGLLCWAVFALASYPLSIPQLCVLLVVFLAAAAAPCSERGFEGEIRGFSPISRKTAGIPIISALLGLALCVMALQLGEVGSGRRSVWPSALRPKSTELQRSVDYRRLYSDGHALFQAGRFAESLEVLGRAARLSSDPMFDIIIGRDHEALGEPGKARESYLRAYYMVPGRLYPLVRLMRLQVAAGQDAQALQTARTLLDLPVNPRHRTMQRLHDEASATRDSLEVTSGLARP